MSMAIMGKRAASVPAGLSPERTALGEAIAAALAAKAKRDAALAAEEPAINAVSRARDRVEAAEAEVVAARAEGGRQAAASLMAGDVLEAPPGVRQARTALIDAEEDLAVAIAARDSLNERRVGDDDAVRRTHDKLEDAVSSVIRAEAGARVKALTAELIATQRKMVCLADEAQWLLRVGAIPTVQEHGFSFGKPIDAELHKAMFRSDPMNQPMQGDRLIDLLPRPSPSMIWTQAATALETDANASLPSAR